MCLTSIWTLLRCKSITVGDNLRIILHANWGEDSMLYNLFPNLHSRNFIILLTPFLWWNGEIKKKKIAQLIKCYLFGCKRIFCMSTTLDPFFHALDSPLWIWNCFALYFFLLISIYLSLHNYISKSEDRSISYFCPSVFMSYVTCFL